MRRRRIMSMAMALCVLASMLAGIPAAAAEEYVWVYTLGFEVILQRRKTMCSATCASGRITRFSTFRA